jgi:hypothetical protein
VRGFGVPGSECRLGLILVLFVACWSGIDGIRQWEYEVLRICMRESLSILLMYENRNYYLVDAAVCHVIQLSFHILCLYYFIVPFQSESSIETSQTLLIADLSCNLD